MRDPSPPPRRSILSDPREASYAWARFRRLLGWAGFAAVVVSGIAIGLVAHEQGEIGCVTMLAIIGGVGGSVMTGGVLMALVFLSSGSGHDEEVERLDR